MRIAVTGGTGRIGGTVARLLGATDEHEVLALSSRTAPYDRPAALRTALTDVDTLVFVSSDGEAARVIVHHRNVLDAATECEVGHVVYLSGLDVAPDSPFCYAFTNADTERRLRSSGLPYSIARAGLYTEFFLDVLRQAAIDRAAALPAGDGRVSLVAREDVARCLAALALREPVLLRRHLARPVRGHTPARRRGPVVGLRLRQHVRGRPPAPLGVHIGRRRRADRAPADTTVPSALERQRVTASSASTRPAP
jgi:NAD(P)H dehydrogenase (quinone)